MAKKNSWLGILVIVLVFGFIVLGCASKPMVSGNGLFEYTLSGIGSPKMATIINYLGTETDVVIPQQIDGNPLWSIDKGVFEEKGLTSVVFPEGLYSIGNRAFANNRLTSVTIPAGAKITNPGPPIITRTSITSIGEAVFEGNPITSFTFSGEIDCNSFDSLGSLTPYYYANSKKSGVYSINDEQWDYNGSSLTEFPAMIILSSGVVLKAIDGDAPNAASIRRNNSGGLGVNDMGYWVPAGQHKLTVGGFAEVEGTGGIIKTSVGGPSVEANVNLQPKIMLLFREKEDKSGVEWAAQGEYSLSTQSTSTRDKR